MRVSTRTGRIIPIPKMAEETPDYKTKATYVEQDKDTTADLVTRWVALFPVVVAIAKSFHSSQSLGDLWNNICHKRALFRNTWARCCTIILWQEATISITSVLDAPASMCLLRFLPPLEVKGVLTLAMLWLTDTSSLQWLITPSFQSII